MATKSGTKCLLYIDTVAFDAQLNSTMAIEKDMLDITVKATSRGKLYSGDGEYTGTLDVEVLYDPNATVGAYQILTKLIAGTLSVLKIGETATVGLSVSGFAKSLNFNFAKNEIATVPITFQMHGEVTTGTV